MSEEYEIEVIPVVVAAEPIELYKILKIENLVTSGSEAKNLIAEGYVYVNGEIETRKRKKIMFGDIIGFNGEAYQVLSAADMAEYELEMAMYDEDEFAEIEPPQPNAQPEVIAQPEAIAKPVPVVEDIWEQPVAKPTEASNKSTTHKPAQPQQQKTAPAKKKGRAAPFSF